MTPTVRSLILKIMTMGTSWRVIMFPLLVQSSVNDAMDEQEDQVSISCHPRFGYIQPRFDNPGGDIMPILQRQSNSRSNANCCPNLAGAMSL
jgi:hypothetical protein